MVPRSGNLGQLIAPPYDVITPAQRSRLAAHPHNIVHVDLPLAMEGVDAYEAAARILRRWIDQGVLLRDEEPSYYLCEQDDHTPDGGSCRRRGLFGRLGLEPLDSGVVIPHERTLEGPRSDRRRLLEATRTHLSPILLLHDDPAAEISGLLARLADEAPVAGAGEGHGHGVRLWRVTDRDAVARLTSLLHGTWVLIADGHHRYESALEFWQSRKGHGPGSVLACLCSFSDPGIRILPIHRIVRSVTGFDATRVRERLGAWFDLEPVADATTLPARVASHHLRPGSFGLLFGGEGGGWVALWREGAGLDSPGLAALPVPLRTLDVILLHRLILEETLGIGQDALARQEHLEYVKDERELVKRAASGQLSVLLNPIPIRQVVEVARAGLRLPQKSTYFYPKVPTGLVLDPLDD